MTKVLLAGGGTGGHIMPAIALAESFKEKGFDILFVGSKNRMEANLVPAHGFKIKFIWISAFHRSLRISNLIFPLKLVFSLIQSFIILKKFKPDFVVGTGGFASGPILYMAGLAKIKVFLQEQNSFPGITTRLLEKYASMIFIAYERTTDFLKSKNTILFGNPIRNMELNSDEKSNYLKALGLENRQTISIIGGSQGALSINEAFAKIVKEIENTFDINVIWQSGKYSYEKFKSFSSKKNNCKRIYSKYG